MLYRYFNKIKINGDGMFDTLFKLFEDKVQKDTHSLSVSDRSYIKGMSLEDKKDLFYLFFDIDTIEYVEA